MKKLLLILGLTLFMFSCDEEIKNEDNPAAATSIEVSEAAKDTVLLYKKNSEVFYILDKETNLVEYKLYGGSNGATATLVVVILVAVVFLIFGISIGRETY